MQYVYGKKHLWLPVATIHSFAKNKYLSYLFVFLFAWSPLKFQQGMFKNIK
jgi:hypothetical protein